MDLSHIHQTLVESMTEAVYVRDRDMNILYINPAAEKLVGQSQQQAKRKKCFELFGDQEARCRERCPVEKVIASGDPISVHEHRLMTQSGDLLEMRLSISPVNEDAGVVGATVIMPDISPLKSAEKTLAQSVLALEKEIEQRQRAEDDLHKRLTELESINSLAKDVVSSLSMDQVITSAQEQLHTVIEPDFLVAYLVEGDVLTAQKGPSDRQRVHVEIPEKKRIGECLCGLVASEGSPVYVKDIKADPRCTLSECKDAGICSFAALPLRNGDNIVGVLGIGSVSERDFSEQSNFLETLASQVTLALRNAKLYERATKQADLLDRLLDKAADGICICHNTREFPHVRFTHWNPRMAEITGYTIEEINESGWYQTMYPDPEIRNRAMQRMTGMRKGDDIRAEEWVITAKDGTERTLSISTSMLEKSGSEVHVVALMQDITERTRVREALFESEKNFRRFFESIDDLAIVGSAEGRITYTNPATSQKLGYSPDELNRMHVLDLHPQTLRAEAEGIFDDMFKGHRDVCPLPLESKAGALIPVETRVWFGKWSGVDCVYGICRDLSREQEAFQKFDRLFRNNPNPMAVSSIPEQKFIDVNDSFLSTLGFTRQEIVGKTSEELGLFPNPEEQRTVAACLEREGRISNIELQVQHKDGTILDGLFSGEVIESQGKKMFLTVMLDITERRRTEAALERSRADLAAIFDSISDAIVFTDTNRRIVQVNPAFTSIWGYCAEEAVGRSTEFLYRDKSEYLELGMKRYNPVLEGPLHPLEMTYRRKDGSTFPAESLGTQVKDSQGNTIGFLGVHRDITQRKKTEDALRESEEKYRSVVENMQDVFYRTDLQGTITMVSPSGSKMIGCESVDQIIGLNVSRDFYKCPEERDRLLALLQQESMVTDFEVELVRLDGNSIIVSTNSHFYYDKSGQPLGVEGVFTNITERRHAEEAVRESEKKFRFLAENTLDVIWQTDLDFRITYVNRAIEQVTGHVPEELIDADVADLFCQEDFIKIRRMASDEVKKGVNASGVILESVVLNKNNEPVPIEVHARVVLDENGDPIAFQGVTRDITERKKAERNLLESEHRWKSALESAGHGVWDWSPITNKVFFSPLWKTMLGYEEHEISDSLDEWDSRVHTEDKASCYRDLEVHLSGKSDFYANEHRLVCKDGAYKWIQDRGQVIERDDENRPTRVIGTHTDITQRKKMEDLIRESEEKYRLIFSKEKDTIALVDAETLKFVDVNDAALELWGYTREELLDMNALEVSAEPELSKVSIAAAHDAQGTHVPIRRHRKKDGTTFPVEISAGPLMWKGRRLTCSIVRDISERQRAQELAIQSARLKSVADLSSGVAHHFNNLLQIIMSGAGFVLDDMESSDLTEAKTCLKKMLTVAERGARMVERLQTFANTRVTISDSYDLAEIVRNAAEIAKPMWMAESEKRGVNIDLELFLEDGCWIRGQENEIEEVISNLLKNAGEALPHGGIIEVKTFKEADEVGLAVRDTGTGIPEKDLPHVFEPFWTTKGFDIGRGMGLAVAHGLVKRHGGTISLESKVGVGSLFTVRFPLSHEPVKKVEQPAPPIAARHLTILVIDDELYVAELVERTCIKAGHKVFNALSGREALRIFEKEKVDLVICDLGMPGMSGWEVGSAIRSICKEKGITKPPFILLTGWGGQELEKHQIKESGTDRVIAKPISPAELVKAVQEIASRH